MNAEIKKLEAEIMDYMVNHLNLPEGMRPVLQLSDTAKVLVIGPAPGIRAHITGIPWNDPSGDRLRSWMALSRNKFYDKRKIALMSMNFWYPGVDKYGGDKPPDIIHTNLWHKKLLALMPDIKMTLLIGYQAQCYYLKDRVKGSLTETIQAWQEYLPEFIVLPHPSWRNNTWIKTHIWFEKEIIPALREKISYILK